MHLITLTAIVLTAAAHPNLFERAACNRDNCLRQVVASNAAPGPAQGSADCSSFFKKTLTPCPVTVTTFTTSTPIVSSTSTVVVSTTSTTTTVVSATTTTTVTSSSTTTVPATTTTTVTVTSAPQQKRGDDSVLDPLFAPRAAAACTTVGSPSKIPAYASSCDSVARYSSACSCDGVTMTTTTLTPVTSTNTATITAPPSTTVVATSTSTSTITATETDTNTLTATTTTTTTVSVTQTTTVTATATVAPSYNGPACNDPNNVQGGGGCSNNCYCDPRTQNPGLGVCDNQVACSNSCRSDADCASGLACITGSATGPCGGPTCASFTACSSSFGKRSLFGNVVDVRDFQATTPNPGAVLLDRPSQ